jgi:hypothetical protein
MLFPLPFDSHPCFDDIESEIDSESGSAGQSQTANHHSHSASQPAAYIDEVRRPSTEPPAEAASKTS